jgi:DNA mismatch endonuclease (patch repair protein)
MDNLTKDQRHKNMQNIKSTNTTPERCLRTALWHLGIRYRKNWKAIPGKPDIVITRCKIAIFIDGDFWHANNLEDTMDRIHSNREYWISKLRENKKRDQEINDLLTEQGWLVLRFWESDIKINLNECVKKICEFIPYL